MNVAVPRMISEVGPEAGLSRTVALRGGHSGAEVVLHSDGRDSFVRKSARGPAQNARLVGQAVKQRLFAAQGFAFPAVRATGLDAARRAYFDMDYIPARSLGDLARTQAPFDAAIVVDAVAHLTRVFRESAEEPLAAQAFHRKIEDIATAAEPSALLARVTSRLLAMDWSGIPASPGHGDLTFENILVTPEGGVVFIDCDEPFASSWQLDLAKLFQDAAGGWCIRAAPSIGAAERLIELGRAFRALAKSLDPALPERLNQFAALHLLRTVPYAESHETASFAVRAAARVLRISE